MFNSRKRIKELEQQKENVHSHLRYSRQVIMEKNDEIVQLTMEVNKLKTFIADKVIEKINVETAGIQLYENWIEHNQTLEDVYQRSNELNKQGWYTVIENEDDNFELFKIKIYGKA